MTRHDMRWRIYAAKTFYFLSGFSFMTWASLIPFLKHTFQIPDDHLGILLLTLGIGALLMMVFAGTLAARFGCRRSMAASGIAISSCIIALSYMPYFYGAIAIVLSLGASLGLLDVVININGIKIERTLRTRIMSGLQALWSLGSFMGAFYFATLLHLGLSWYIVATSSALIILGLTLFFAPHLDGTTSPEQAHSTLFMPKGEIIVIGIICAIYFLIEGSIDDWSGIFLTSEKGLDISHSGIGITLFSAAIFLSRLPGDTIVNRLAPNCLVYYPSHCHGGISHAPPGKSRPLVVCIVHPHRCRLCQYDSHILFLVRKAAHHACQRSRISRQCHWLCRHPARSCNSGFPWSGLFLIYIL